MNTSKSTSKLHLHSTVSVPGAMLHAFRMLARSILTPTLGGSDSYDSCCINEESEAQGGELICSRSQS